MSDTSAHSRATLPGSEFSLREALGQNWWLVLLRGIAAILFGILAFAWPGLTLLTLTLFWGAFALADGVLSLWAAISGKGGAIAPRWWLALVGIAGIIAGLLAFFWPGTTALVLLMFIAVWSIVIGVLEIWGAIQLRKEIEGEWWLILGGLVSIAFGVLLLVRPRCRRIGAGLDDRLVLGADGRHFHRAVVPAEEAQGSSLNRQRMRLAVLEVQLVADRGNAGLGAGFVRVAARCAGDADAAEQ